MNINDLDMDDLSDLLDVSVFPELAEVGFNLGDIANVAKSIVKSPVVKMASTGLALAFPPVGIPIKAGVTAADAVLSAATSKPRTPQQAARKVVAKKLITHTVQAAKKGSTDHKRMVTLLKATLKKRKELTAKLRRAERELLQLRSVCKKQGVVLKKYQQASKHAKVKAKARAKAIKKKAQAAGFLVTTKGKIYRGKFQSAA